METEHIPTVRTGIEGILAFIPHTLGFHPTSSAVLVSIREPRGTLGALARVDLDALADASDGPDLALAVTAHLLRDHASQVLMVVYTDTDPRASHERPADALTQDAVRTFQDAAADTFGEVPVWVVTPTGWLALDCTDQHCCPPGGRSMDAVDSSEVAAALVWEGSAPADSAEQLAVITPALPAAREQAMDAYAQRQADKDTAGDGDALQVWRRAALAAWRQAVRDGAEATAQVLGTVACGLNDVRTRDAVLVCLTPDSDAAADASLVGDVVSGAASEALVAALDLIISPVTGVRPGVDVRAYCETLERVVAHTDETAAVPALTLLGILAWWTGSGARARVLADRALAANPGYQLAGLVRDVVARGMAPGWVARDLP